MNKKHNAFEKIGKFIAGKGFYLVVLICVAAIALSGFYLVRSVQGEPGTLDDQPVGGTAAIPSPSPSQSPSAGIKPALPVKPSTSPSVTVKPSPGPSASPSVSPSPAVTAPPAPSASSSPAPAALVFTWPVNGTVISDYSVEALAYDVTMGDWRTHSGIDIGVSVGTEVRAAAAGTVSAIYKDDLLGTTVVIDHGKDLTSIYSNLAAVPTVKVGDKVSTGTIIGTVGKTAIAESGLAPHLHFSLHRADDPVDPMDYLPER